MKRKTVKADPFFFIYWKHARIMKLDKSMDLLKKMSMSEKELFRRILLGIDKQNYSVLYLEKNAQDGITIDTAYRLIALDLILPKTHDSKYSIRNLRKIIVVVNPSMFQHYKLYKTEKRTIDYRTKKVRLIENCTQTELNKMKLNSKIATKY